MATYCNRCEKDFGMTNEPHMIDNKRYCDDCAEKVLQNKYGPAMGKMVITTTHIVQGKSIKKYLSIVSAEIIIGTAGISEIQASIADMFGKRAEGFEKKLLEAKDAAISKMKMQACALGANGIVGVDLDYGVLSGNKMMVVANGTAVELE